MIPDRGLELVKQIADIQIIFGCQRQSLIENLLICKNFKRNQP